MSHEVLPPTPRSKPDLAYFRKMKKTYNLKAREVMQEITVKIAGESITTTFGEAVSEPTCPMGDRLKQANEEGGREKVKSKVASMSDFMDIKDPIVQAATEINQRIEQRHQWIEEKSQKKN